MSRLEKVGERIVMGIQRIQYYLYHHLILRVCWGERVQHVVMFLSLYYLCDTIMQGRAIFAGLQRSEWLTYIGIVHLLRASILQQTVEAREGTREKFMGLRSIVRQGGSHFLSFQFPTLLIAIVELFLLSFIFSIPWKFPQYGATWFLFVFSLLGSYFLSVFLNHLLYRKSDGNAIKCSCCSGICFRSVSAFIHTFSSLVCSDAPRTLFLFGSCASCRLPRETRGMEICCGSMCMDHSFGAFVPVPSCRSLFLREDKDKKCTIFFTCERLFLNCS